jgi:hypothetical protein
MNSIIVRLLVALAMSVSVAHAQDSNGDRHDPKSDTTRARKTPEELDERTTAVEGEIAKLKAVRISGYVQTEWQHFDQRSSVGGRALYSDPRKNLFTIRRGRIKFQHKTSTMSMVLQPDITERGVVVKDAFAEFYVVPKGELTINVGIFSRPNYEVELSSSAREATERSQVVRAFYPDERDLGVMFTTHQKLGDGFTPRLQLGIFNGVGTTPEIDPFKDIITRLTFPLPLGRESKLHVDLGASYYYGGIPQTGDSITRTVEGKNTLVLNDESGDLAGFGNRRNIGVEAQISLDLLPIGSTILRGEFLDGRRPTAGVAAVRRDTLTFTPAVNARALQIRNQRGFYAYLVQNLGTGLQLVARYDMFDRNTDLAGAQVTRSDDAAVSVLGVGLNAFIENLRITAFYEMPTMATDEVVAGIGDLKDNKTTIRFQYKF